MNRVLRHSLIGLATLLLPALPGLAGWTEGVASFRAGDFVAAERELREEVEQHPDSSRGHHYLALALAELDRDDEALDHLRTAHELAPEDRAIEASLVAFLVAAAHLSRDRAKRDELFDEALPLAAALAETEPGAASWLLHCAARVGAERGKAMGTCEAAAGAALAENHEIGLAYFFLGWSYVDAGRYAAAEKALLAALDATPEAVEQHEIWKYLGFVYEKQKRYSESILAYEKGSHPDDVLRSKDSTMPENGDPAKLEAMREEAARLEEELRALEETKGGGGRN